MNYQHIWDKTLNSSEKVEYEFSISDRYRWGALIFFILISIPLFFLAGAGVITLLIGIGMFFWLKAANAYALTEKRVLVHTGWTSTNLTSIDYDKIVQVTVQENFSERLFYKSGNLSIKAAGLGHDVWLKHIDRPYEVKKKLDELAARAKA